MTQRLSPRAVFFLLIAGAIVVFGMALRLMVENGFKYLACNLSGGGGAPYCTDGTWSAAQWFGIAFGLGGAGIVMVMLAGTYRIKPQVVTSSQLPPPPPPPPPATA